MKAINEIRVRLCGLICMVLIPLFSGDYLSDNCWWRLCSIAMVIMLGSVLGCFLTNLLIVFKQWWKE